MSKNRLSVVIGSGGVLCAAALGLSKALRREGLSEDEAVTLISVAVDFGITQVVNGNWGVHAIIRKSLFTKA